VPGSYATIQAAINASVNGDTGYAARTYGQTNYWGQKIGLQVCIMLNDPATIIATIINGSTPVHPDTGSCVIIGLGDSTTVLQGFTITGGAEPGGMMSRVPNLLGWRHTDCFIHPIIQDNFIHGNIVTNNGVSTGGGGIRSGNDIPGFIIILFMKYGKI
jgi:hypothetical protein